MSFWSATGSSNRLSKLKSSGLPLYKPSAEYASAGSGSGSALVTRSRPKNSKQLLPLPLCAESGNMKEQSDSAADELELEVSTFPSPSWYASMSTSVLWLAAPPRLGAAWRTGGCVTFRSEEAVGGVGRPVSARICSSFALERASVVVGLHAVGAASVAGDAPPWGCTQEGCSDLSCEAVKCSESED